MKRSDSVLQHGMNEAHATIRIESAQFAHKVGGAATKDSMGVLLEVVRDERVAL
jgi:hypothetical protein